MRPPGRSTVGRRVMRSVTLRGTYSTTHGSWGTAHRAFGTVTVRAEEFHICARTDPFERRAHLVRTSLDESVARRFAKISVLLRLLVALFVRPPSTTAFGDSDLLLLTQLLSFKLQIQLFLGDVD
jgi:hypothetical protein